MKLQELKKIKSRTKKRVGRGESSGKGKTAGRGAKGQKKREKVKLGFEGGQLPIYKRLPQRRGLGNLRRGESITLKIEDLNVFASGSTVDEESLRKAQFIPRSRRRIKVKIVGGGRLEKKLNVAVPTSKEARKQIEEAGGKVVS